MRDKKDPFLFFLSSVHSPTSQRDIIMCETVSSGIFNYTDTILLRVYNDLVSSYRTVYKETVLAAKAVEKDTEHRDRYKIITEAESEEHRKRLDLLIEAKKKKNSVFTVACRIWSQLIIKDEHNHNIDDNTFLLLLSRPGCTISLTTEEYNGVSDPKSIYCINHSKNNCNNSKDLFFMNQDVVTGCNPSADKLPWCICSKVLYPMCSSCFSIVCKNEWINNILSYCKDDNRNDSNYEGWCDLPCPQCKGVVCPKKLWKIVVTPSPQPLPRELEELEKFLSAPISLQTLPSSSSPSPPPPPPPPPQPPIQLDFTPLREELMQIRQQLNKQSESIGKLSQVKMEELLQSVGETLPSDILKDDGTLYDILVEGVKNRIDSTSSNSGNKKRQSRDEGDEVDLKKERKSSSNNNNNNNTTTTTTKTQRKCRRCFQLGHYQKNPECPYYSSYLKETKDGKKEA
jgi:hypothetical protein